MLNLRASNRSGHRPVAFVAIGMWAACLFVALSDCSPKCYPPCDDDLDAALDQDAGCQIGELLPFTCRCNGGKAGVYLEVPVSEQVPRNLSCSCGGNLEYVQCFDEPYWSAGTVSCAKPPADARVVTFSAAKAACEAEDAQ